MKKQNLLSNLVTASLATCILLFAVNPTNAQWTNASGLTSHDHTTDDILFSGTFVTGFGKKLLYNYGKGAFRGGYATSAGLEFDPDSLGTYSFAYGFAVKATGIDGSFAVGYKSEASGNFGSIALGNEAVASGNLGSVALGYKSSARGSFGSIAIGQSCNSYGTNGSVAIGRNSSSFGGVGSIALGASCTVYGDNGALAFGHRAISQGGTSVAIGAHVESDTLNAFTIGGGKISFPFVPLVNNIPQSLMIGFNSNLPTLFVGTSPGTDTTGNVGIATTSPQQKLDVNGAINIGTTDTGTAGAMRYNLGAFEGHDGNSWKPFGGGSSNWDTLSNNAYRLSGKIGLGLNNPNKNIHMHDAAGGSVNIKFTNSFTGLTNSDGFEVGIGISGTNNRARVWNKEYTHMVFATNNTERMRIHKDGNVGIGTTAIPQQTLDVNGAINVGSTTAGTAGAIRYNGSNFQGYNGSTWLALDVDNNTDAQSLTLSGNTLNLSSGTGGGGSINLSTYLDNTDAQNLSIAGQTLTISGGNNVTLPNNADDWGSQVVITSPVLGGNGTLGNRLSLAQQGATNNQVLKWNGSTWAPANDVDTDTDAQNLTISGNTLNLSSGTGGGGSVNLSTYLDNTDAQNLSISGQTLTISGGNNVTLPNNADNWGSQVVQTSASFSGNGTTGNGLSLAQQGANVDQILKWDGSAWTPANDNAGVSIWNQTGVDAHYTSGNVGIGTATPTAQLHVSGDIAVAGSIVHPSDKNLKENITAITNGLSTINQLSPKSYTHKTNKAEEFGLSTKPQFGLIAQEVEEVLPEIVIQKALVGKDGEIYKGLDYEKLIPILVAALQEANEKVDKQNETILQQKVDMQAMETGFTAQLKELTQTVEALANNQNLNTK